MKKLCAIIATVLATAMFLSGCGFFDTEYVSIEDYAPTVQEESPAKDKITVHNIASLQQAIRTIISSGDTEGKIVFDTAYDGDPTEDMSKACWQVRTQDALCAYCVENISYELSKIITYYEARLSISYSDFIKNSDDIVYLPFSAGIENIIKKAISDGSTKLVILVDHSMYTAEDVARLVLDVYRQSPASAPRAPYTSVNMYSGSNMQRLYEVNMSYGMSAEELAVRQAKLKEFAPFTEVEFSELDDAQRALIAYEYIVENCAVGTSGVNANIYNALIEGKADSEGIALAFVELCRQLELECQIVYGQHDWQEHCWNIIRIDDYYCHVDAGLSDNRDVESCFLKSDESFWESYRWDMSSYPACTAKPPEEEAEILEETDELSEPEEESSELADDAEEVDPSDTEVETVDEELLILELLEEI